MTGLARSGSPWSPGCCPAWCRRADRHNVHIRRLGLAESVQVLLVRLDGGCDARLREPHLVLDPLPPAVGHTGAWVPVGEASQLAAIVARLGHHRLADLITWAAQSAAADGGS